LEFLKQQEHAASGILHTDFEAPAQLSRPSAQASTARRAIDQSRPSQTLDERLCLID
jgi:hypothetical protein